MLKRPLLGVLLVLGVVPFVTIGDRVEARMAAGPCSVKAAPGEMLSIAYSAPSGSRAISVDMRSADLRTLICG